MMFLEVNAIKFGIVMKNWIQDSSDDLVIILFFRTTRPSLGPTQPPSQRAPGNHSPGVKRPEREPEHSPPYSSILRIRSGGVTLLPNISFHCVP